MFRNNWVNPAYGGGDANPGCYYDYYLGDVHFIMLDGRYYRDLKPPQGQIPTMLGPVQRQWLLDNAVDGEQQRTVLEYLRLILLRSDTNNNCRLHLL